MAFPATREIDNSLRIALSPAAPSVARAGSVRAERLVAAGIFGLALAVYLATMCRSVYTGDDGDFITAMATGGVPHPTGYPLFCALGRLFLLLVPFGEPAFRINLLTAVFGAASVAILYRFLHLLSPRRIWAVFGALMFAFSGTMWQQCLSCEVYALTCLFLAGVLYVGYLWYTDPADTRLLYGLALLFGLSLTNHVTMALYLPAFVMLVLLRRRSLLREGAVLASLVGCFVAPLLFYAYLPLAAAFSGAPVTWDDPQTLKGFVQHVSAAQYRGLFLAHPQSIVGNLIWYRDQLAREFGWGSLALAAVGVVAWFRDPSRRAYGGLLAFIFVADVSFAVCYNVFDAYVFFLPSYLVVAALLTVGAGASADLACRSLRLGEDVRSRIFRAAMPVALGVALVQMSFHYAANDKSGNFLEADFSSNLLLSAPPRTVLIAQGSMLFSLWYREFALHERRDVTVVSADMFKAVADRGHWYARHLERCDPSLRPLLGSPGLSRVPADSLLVALVANALGEGRPVLFVGNGAFEAPGETSGDFTPAEVMLNRAFDEAAWGLAYRLYPKGHAPRTGDLVAATAPLWERFRTRGVYDGWAHNDPLQEHIARRYAQGGVSFAKLAERAGRFDLADAAYARASLLYQIPDADAGRARCAEHLRRSAQAPNARPVTPRE